MQQGYNQALATYRMVAAQVPPLVAVVKLYDEAIRQLRMAVRAIEARRFEESHANITKASTILRGLCHNLRFDKGEDVAESLMKAYTQNIIAIHTAYGRPDAFARYGKIIRSLTTMRDAFADIAGLTTIGERSQPRAMSHGAPVPLARRA